VKARSVAALLLLVVAACSSGPTPPVAIPGRVVDKGRVDNTSGRPFSVEIQSGDDWFSPTWVKGAPGVTVTVAVTSVGDTAHTFTIDSQHIDVVLGGRGDKRTVSVTLPPPGQPLVFYCKYHREVGMQGAFYSSG